MRRSVDRCGYVFAVVLAVVGVVAIWIGVERYRKDQVAPLLSEGHEIPMDLIDVNGVSFYHVKSFNTEWVLTAPNEVYVRDVFEQKVSACASGVGGLILDVGANTGIYGLYAAASGCRTIMLDPQPQCHLAIRAAIAANGFGDRARLIPYAATEDRRSIDVTNQSQCLTSLSMAQDLNGRHSHRLRGALWYGARTVRLDDVVGPGEVVDLMKVDTEGSEYTVLRSAMGLFAKKQIRAFVCELSPPWWGHFGVDADEMIDLFLDLWDSGYNRVTVLESHEKEGGPYRIETRGGLVDLLYGYEYKQVDVYVELDERYRALL